jgi:hypothetical protein
MNPKPLPFIVKKPKIIKNRGRLPERKYMTLIAAFSGAGGLAFFADSQETRQGYGKKSVDKLELWQCKGFNLLIGGAGAADYIDNLLRRIAALAGQVQTCDMDAIVAAARETTHTFFRDCVWNRTEKPELELLFAIQPKQGGASEFFHVSDGIVNHIPGGSKSIGIGSYLADFLMEKVDDFGQGEAELIAVATYVLKEVKEHVDGVGLNSSVWILRKDGSCDLFEQYELKELEELMSRFNEAMKVAFDSAFDITDQAASPINLGAELSDIRNEYAKWFESRDEQRNRELKKWAASNDRLRGRA